MCLYIIVVTEWLYIKVPMCLVLSHVLMQYGKECAVIKLRLFAYPWTMDYGDQTQLYCAWAQTSKDIAHKLLSIISLNLKLNSLIHHPVI